MFLMEGIKCNQYSVELDEVELRELLQIEQLAGGPDMDILWCPKWDVSEG